jgi:hypothetical protein
MELEPDMGFREKVNAKPKVGAAIALIVVLAGGWFIYKQTRPEQAPAGGPQVYYSDDDGKTWFPGGVTQVPPIDHNGKEAVRCFVFEAGGQPFAGYLKKFSRTVASRLSHNLPVADVDYKAGTLVKRPGDRDWTPMSDAKAADIINPRSATNSGAEVTEVLP